MKLCKDCKHSYSPVPLLYMNYVLYECRREERVTNQVDGSRYYPFCHIIRSSSLSSLCGTDGKFFEPKIVETKE